jgi:hypothetical protein
VKASGKFCLSNPVFTNPDNYTGRRKRGRERGNGKEKDAEREKKKERTVLNVKMQELKCLR